MEDLASLGLTPDVVVIGASGGGPAGISLAVKARAPDVKITAEPKADDTARSFRSGKHEA